MAPIRTEEIKLTRACELTTVTFCKSAGYYPLRVYLHPSETSIKRLVRWINEHCCKTLQVGASTGYLSVSITELDWR